MEDTLGTNINSGVLYIVERLHVSSRSELWKFKNYIIIGKPGILEDGSILCPYLGS